MAYRISAHLIEYFLNGAVDDRRSLVELMAYDDDGGMSTRQIGAALGVGKSTIDRDLAGVPFGTPERKIQGSDGKTYTGPSPEEQARRADETRERLINEPPAH